MSNIEELKKAELKQINEGYDELAELERLIVAGANAKIPYIIEYPMYDEKTGEIKNEEVTVKLSPITSTEWNNAVNVLSKNRDEMYIKLVAKGLYTKDEQEFPLKLIRLMPSGVIKTLYHELARISGVELNSREDIEMVKEIMGF